jgi:hypothetical protein
MTDPGGRTLDRLSEQPLGRVSMASDDGYAAAMAIWTSRSGACRALSSTAGWLRTCASPFEPHAPAVFRCLCAAEATIGRVEPCVTASLSTWAA